METKMTDAVWREVVADSAVLSSTIASRNIDRFL
mgnify:CR=1 FL=1